MTDRADEAGGRAALLAPGGNYGPDGPLLMFGGAAAQERGALIRTVSWGLLDGHLSDEDLYARVETTVAAALDDLGPAVAPVIMGKSLGSVSASVAADRGIPAVWFTPLLTEARVVSALRRAAAPFLLVGGTADDWWDEDVARSVTPHVVEIDGANHRMFVPGPLKESAAALGEVASAVECFLDDVAWPA
ncbi:MAG TPA: hypothetical protein VGG75_19320 [Trebonia sp.]